MFRHLCTKMKKKKETKHFDTFRAFRLDHFIQKILLPEILGLYIYRLTRSFNLRQRLWKFSWCSGASTKK